MHYITELLQHIRVLREPLQGHTRVLWEPLQGHTRILIQSQVVLLIDY